MLRFLGTLILLAIVFGLGYYAGQRPVSELKQTVMDLSRKVTNISRSAVETTLGLERTLRWRQGLIDAKGKVVEARADVLDHNLGNAAKELGDAEESLEKVRRDGTDGERALHLKSVIEKLHLVKSELAAGKAVPRSTFDELQKELDSLANQ